VSEKNRLLDPVFVFPKISADVATGSAITFKNPACVSCLKTRCKQVLESWKCKGIEDFMEKKTSTFCSVPRPCHTTEIVQTKQIGAKRKQATTTINVTGSTIAACY